MIALPLVVIQQNIASYPVALSNYFYLESKSHPSLGKFQEADLALGIGRLFRSRYAFVRSASVFIPGHVPLPLAAHNNTKSQNTGNGFLFPQWGKKATLRLEVSWCGGLGSHANAGRCAAAFLALETDVAEEAVSGDASTLEEHEFSTTGSS